MKICHVTNVHGAFDGRIFHKMACSAAEQGHEVTLIAPHIARETRNGVKIIPIDKHPNRMRRFWGTFKLSKIMIEVDADVYHFHDPELIPLMRHVHKKTRKKVIYDVHEYYREVILAKTWIPSILRKAVSQIAWCCEVSACRSFDCTIAATEELARVYRPYSRRSEFILNYDFKEGLEMGGGSSPSEIDIIHVGTLSPQRFEFLLQVAVELFRRGCSCQWCFVGVPKGLLETVGGRLLNQDQLKHIRTTGRVPFEDVKDFYRQSRIGINYHPLDKRFLVAIPMKIFEYMKHGLAVVTTDLPPLRKFIADGVSGAIVKENTIETFADAIEQLMKSDSLSDIGERNKRAVFQHYNWESEAKRLMEIYETL